MAVGRMASGDWHSTAGLPTGHMSGHLSTGSPTQGGHTDTSCHRHGMPAPLWRLHTLWREFSGGPCSGRDLPSQCRKPLCEHAAGVSLGGRRSGWCHPEACPSSGTGDRDMCSRVPRAAPVPAAERAPRQSGSSCPCRLTAHQPISSSPRQPLPVYPRVSCQLHMPVAPCTGLVSSHQQFNALFGPSTPKCSLLGTRGPGGGGTFLQIDQHPSRGGWV